MTAPALKTSPYDDVLELSTLAPERPKARIKTDEDPDGTIYELAVPEDFGAAPLAALSSLFTDLDDLWERPNRKPSEDKRLEKLLDDLAQRLIPDAPPAAVAALPALQKRMVAVRFFVAAGLAAANLAPAEMVPSPEDASQPGSN